jgi:nicotinamide mononucleotide transporter
MDIYYLEKLELFSAFFSIVTFYLGTKQRQATWPVSMTISLMNLPLYYFKRIYGSFLQNIIYMIISLYGWYCWRYGGENRTELKVITTTPLKEAFLLLIGVLLYVVIMNPILVRLGSTVTLLDATRSALTMAGMWVTSHKKLETYPIWFIVNAISIYMFFQKEMYWFMAKYVFMVCLSVYSYHVWYKQYQTQKEEGTA